MAIGSAPAMIVFLKYLGQGVRIVCQFIRDHQLFGQAGIPQKKRRGFNRYRGYFFKNVI
ncbi:MAG: hypothetical protein R2874_16000 [Desulfobacterales bacterium]